MRGCLSDNALDRILAELGRPDELAHLAACQMCAARLRRASRQLAAVARVLSETPEPAGLVERRGPAWWKPAIGVAAAALVAGLAWTEVAVWNGHVPGLAASAVEEAQSAQIAQALESLSDTMFSVTGEPTPAFAATEAAPSEPESLADDDCDAADDLTGLECTEPADPSTTLAWLLDENPPREDELD